MANAVIAENQLPGVPPEVWDLKDRPGDPWGHGDATIEGFATEVSVEPGGGVEFKVATPSGAYHLDIYRLGWYAGFGARLVATVTPHVALPQAQPPPIVDPLTGLVDCGTWGVSARWDVPVDAVSGLYLAKLVSDDAAGANHIPFIVRPPAGTTGGVLVQMSDTTWHAYNPYGGANLYMTSGVGGPAVLAAGRAFAVSYNRPLRTRSNEWGLNYLFNAEFPMIRWLEANGYDVAYCAGVDVARSPGLLVGYRAFMSVGHDEYWSGDQRANVEAVRDAGTHLLFCSGNEVYWRVRWEPSRDPSATPWRTMVCYKETSADRRVDPTGEWTGTFRDGRFTGGGGHPENALTGTWSRRAAGIGRTAIRVPAPHAVHRVWRGTDLAARPDPMLTIGTLGYEWDSDDDNGARPAGLMRLSETVEDWNPAGLPEASLTAAERTWCLWDQGTIYTVGSATHHLTLHRHPSGALVFGAGTVQWAWGLDDEHDTQNRPSGPADPAARQAMVNLLADMGVQPGTLQPGLSPATASTDVTPPLSTIISPADGDVLVPGRAVEITGIAEDTDGIVAAVEVSTDGGVIWRPAAGTSAWACSWTPDGNGPTRLLSRAVDDSGNLESPSVGPQVVVGDATGAAVLLLIDRTNRTNPFGPYLAEILRAEGVVSFETVDVAHLLASDDPAARLAAAPVVLLAEVRADDVLHGLVRAHVTNGGRLVAMRPPVDLLDVFGLAHVEFLPEPPAGPLRYLVLDTAAGPGRGLVSESIVFHGGRDRCTLAGATALGWFWDGLDASSDDPAVVVHEHGAGRAACFLFDLAADVVLSRQGNPDWRNSEGDGVLGITAANLAEAGNTNAEFRPMDMFTRTPSAAAADGRVWFEPRRLHAPTTDDKQRFLVNLLEDVSGRALVRLWYLPDTHRSLIVNTGDGELYDEATMNQPFADADRYGAQYTAFLRRPQIPVAPAAGTVSAAAVAGWRAAGHEVAVHVHNTDVDATPVNGDSGIQTELRLRAAYDDIAAALQTAYGVRPRTARNHTIEWVGWVEMAAIEAAAGTMLDLNAYHFWLRDAPLTPVALRFTAGDAAMTGYYTGSGLPLRMCDERGRLLPTFQLLTEWPDEFFYNNGFVPEQVFATVIEPMLRHAEAGAISAFVTNVHPGPYWTPAAKYNTAQRTSAWVTAMWAHAHDNGIPVWSAERFLTFSERRSATTVTSTNWSESQLGATVTVPAGDDAVSLAVPADGLRALAVDGADVTTGEVEVAGRRLALAALPAGRPLAVVATYWAMVVHRAADFALGTHDGTTILGAGDGLLSLGNGPAEPGSVLEPWPAVIGGPVPAWSGTAKSARHHLNPSIPSYHAALIAGSAPTTNSSISCRQRITQVASAAGSIGTLGLVVGAVDPAHWWHVQFAQGGYGLKWYRRSAASTFTLLADAPGAPPPETGRWYDLRVEVDGPRLDLYVDEKPVLGTQDPAFVNGRVGILGYQGAQVEVTELIVTAGEPTLGIYTSQAIDAGQRRRLEIDATVPTGTVLIAQLRAGDTSEPDATWSAFRTATDTGDVVDVDGRYAQYRLLLATSHPARRPHVRAVILRSAAV